MKEASRKALSIWPFLAIWTGLNLWQSVSTELLHDEAYYWVYSQNLAWGYFDHPPGVAIMIWLGQWLPGELGVRLTTILTSSAIFAFLYYWIKPERKVTFFLFLGSITIFHVGGFVIAPDIPLIALSCLFLVVFERYLQSDTWLHAVILGVVCALLMYAKYHGAILILCAIASQLRLLRRPSFWALSIMAVLLFLPHLYWQWTHDFVTFRFHLFERGSRGFRWVFPLNYVGSQILIYGPLAGFLIVAAVRSWPRVSPMHRVHRCIVIGVFAFFFLNSLRGRVEANWTAIALPSLIYLSWKAFENRPALMKWVTRLALPSIVLIMGMRLCFAFPILLESKFVETHNWGDFATRIEGVAEGRKIVFANSYQQAAKFWFYSGEPAYSLNEPIYKGNQFDLLIALRDSMLTPPVAFFHSAYDRNLIAVDSRDVETPIGTFHHRTFDRDFRHYLDLRLHPNLPETARSGSELHFEVKITNVSEQTLDIPRDSATQLVMWMKQPGRNPNHWLLVEYSDEVKLPGSTSQVIAASVILPSDPGAFDLRIGFQWQGTGGKSSALYPLILTQ